MTNTQPVESWEERFRAMFPNLHAATQTTGEIEDFIKTIEQEAYQRGKVESLEKALEWFGHYGENGDFVYDFEPRNVSEIVVQARKEEREKIMERIEELANSYRGRFGTHTSFELEDRLSALEDVMLSLGEEEK